MIRGDLKYNMNKNSVIQVRSWNVRFFKVVVAFEKN